MTRLYARRLSVSTALSVFVGCGIVLGDALASHSPRAAAAAPWIILIEGERPGTRIVLADWEVNGRFMRAVARPTTVNERSLASRKSRRVALFWGPEWQAWRELRIDPDTLSFDRGNQHATLYEATGTDSPVWVFRLSLFLQQDLVRRIDSSGVALLLARGVALSTQAARQ